MFWAIFVSRSARSLECLMIFSCWFSVFSSLDCILVDFHMSLFSVNEAFYTSTFMYIYKYSSFYIYISVHLYYIDNWWCLRFSNSDLPFQQCLPIRKEAFPIFSLVKTNEMAWFPRTHGFPTNISKNIVGKWHLPSLSDSLGCGWHGFDLRPHASSQLAFQRQLCLYSTRTSASTDSINGWGSRTGGMASWHLDHLARRQNERQFPWAHQPRDSCDWVALYFLL